MDWVSIIGAAAFGLVVWLIGHDHGDRHDDERHDRSVML
jgi:hypothetical protein